MRHRKIVAAVVALLMSSTVAYANCPQGEQLLWEDEDYWHCGVVSSARDVGQVLERQELLGDEWRFRKQLMDALRSLKGEGYQMGAKFDVALDGQVTHFCTGAPCRGDRTVDCSGVAAYGQMSACVVSGFCRAAYPELRQGVLGQSSNAAGIASFFHQHGAFNSGPPLAGDLIFFADRGAPKERHGIVHTAIYLGVLGDGTTIIFHATGRPLNKALFQNLKPGDGLLSRIVGYGNVSKLVRTLRH